MNSQKLLLPLLLALFLAAAAAQPLTVATAASAPFEVRVKNEPVNDWLQPASAIGLLGALGASVALLLQRRWHLKDKQDADNKARDDRQLAEARAEREHQRAQELAERERELLKRRTDRDRLLMHALDSLKWFESGSQKRSIGLSVIEGYWEQLPELRHTWLRILVNQGLYLLVESGQGDAAHERANLVRIMRLVCLQEVKLDDSDRKELLQAIEESKSGSGVRGIAAETYTSWEERLGAA